MEFNWGQLVPNRPLTVCHRLITKSDWVKSDPCPWICQFNVFLTSSRLRIKSVFTVSPTLTTSAGWKQCDGNVAESCRQSHISWDKLFCDEHREQLLRIFAQNLRIQHLHHRAFNTEGSNCYYYGRVLMIAIARCESELACPIVPRLLSTSHSHQIVDVHMLWGKNSNMENKNEKWATAFQISRWKTRYRWIFQWMNGECQDYDDSYNFRS